ncbi:MAG: hypothetical protein KU38_10980 [Sulfurovum sp. FS08-3]|nr:MAG: hypothetical protein KU38_10980 [Sulfurovum sp. FS08-3]
MLERLEVLENNIAKLKEYKSTITFQDLENDKFNEWSLRYGLFESIQIIIDISCHLVNRYNLGNPKSYGECIVLLKQSHYINQSLHDKLIQIIGPKNILIHEYIAIDMKKLYDFLDLIDDFGIFVQQIQEYIQQ